MSAHEGQPDDPRFVTNDVLRKILRKEAAARKATVLPYSPTHIYIDPCNACDLRCTFCPQSNWGERKRGMMSWEIFEQALAECVKLRPNNIHLFCYGEATLHPKIYEMIRAGVDAGQWIRIHTNAKTLDEKKARGLLDAGLSELHFSFDTADREAYNRMRVRSDFDRVLANIHRFLDLKAKGGYEHPIVYVQELVPYREGVKAQTSDAYRRLFDGFDVIFDPRNMHNFAGASQETEFAVRTNEQESHCGYIYAHIVVTWDGKIHACCVDAEGHNIVGDLTKGDTIASSWNGERMRQLRQRTNDRQLEGLKPCDTCDELWRRKAPRTLPQKAIGRLGWALAKAFGSPGT